MHNLQQYKIVLVRNSFGQWILTGYWQDSVNQAQWNIDGAALTFTSRREAVEHLAKASGVPE